MQDVFHEGERMIQSMTGRLDCRPKRKNDPKGHDFATVSEEELAIAIRLINHRPRKCLGWKSAYEAFMDELSHLA